jgi:CIC family chloride channel protein
LSAGHGALHLDLILHLSMMSLAIILLLKIAASVVSLSFGFRGGLFFASLFLGSLVGQLFAGLVNAAHLGIVIDGNDAALVGMAALSVSIVGGPMTLSLLILEATHDFALMGVVLTASLVASAFTREMFGYSFSTWRLHLRGSAIRSPRDIGWMMALSAGHLMRQDPTLLRNDVTIAEFRTQIPLGSTSKVVLADADGRADGGRLCARA